MYDDQSKPLVILLHVLCLHGSRQTAINFVQEYSLAESVEKLFSLNMV